MSTLAERYQDILRRMQLAAERSSHRAQVQLIAVSKRQPVEAIQELYSLGHRDFGENYVQELVEKAKELESRDCTGIRWHFIGHLQTNKVKMILPWVSVIHTVDSLRIAEELAKRWVGSGRSGKLPVFVEVNIDQEESKTGFSKENTVQAVRDLANYSELDVQGLMCIPSPVGDSRGRFRELKALNDKCGDLTQKLLSMGMSEDFEAAIQEGATHIRVGTALFGSRSPK